MKIIFVVSLMFLLQNSFAQTNVYTFNNGGNFFSENELRASFESTKKDIPSPYVLVPIIYHRAVKKDTIINYLSFSMEEKGTTEFKLLYKQDSTYLHLNKKLPYFKLKELDGQEISSTQLLGKPTLINFWAIWCAPCIAEMPQLSMLKDKYKDEMNFISITQNREAEDQLKNFLADKKFNFQVLENGKAFQDEINIHALPRNLFIDKNGVIRYIQGNYPLGANSTPLEINDAANNHFVKKIEELIKEGK